MHHVRRAEVESKVMHGEVTLSANSKSSGCPEDHSRCLSDLELAYTRQRWSNGSSWAVSKASRLPNAVPGLLSLPLIDLGSIIISKFDKRNNSHLVETKTT